MRWFPDRIHPGWIHLDTRHRPEYRQLPYLVQVRPAPGTRMRHSSRFRCRQRNHRLRRSSAMPTAMPAAASTGLSVPSNWRSLPTKPPCRMAQASREASVTTQIRNTVQYLRTIITHFKADVTERSLPMKTMTFAATSIIALVAGTSARATDLTTNSAANNPRPRLALHGEHRRRLGRNNATECRPHRCLRVLQHGAVWHCLLAHQRRRRQQLCHHLLVGQSRTSSATSSR